MYRRVTPTATAPGEITVSYSDADDTVIDDTSITITEGNKLTFASEGATKMVIDYTDNKDVSGKVEASASSIDWTPAKGEYTFTVTATNDDNLSTTFDETILIVNAATGVAKPTISVNANEVTLSADDGCTIYYTLDGNDPTKESTAYENTPFDVTKDCTVKAIAYDAEGNASKVESADVTYVRVATPTFNPASEYVASGTTVAIETATEGAKIFYFLNDATEATEYTAPLTITEATTIKAYATADHYGDSETVTQSYQIGSFVTMTSTLNATNFSASGTGYDEYSYDDTKVGAKYSGYLNTGDKTNDYFGIRPYSVSGKTTTKGGGIVTLVSPGTVKSITLTQYSEQSGTATKSVNIYGSHTAYTKGQQDNTSTDCFGTKLFDDATVLTKGQAVTVDLSTLSEQYEYIAIASANGTCQFSSIEITWNVVKEAGTVVVNEPKITNDGNLVTITPNEDDNKDNTVIYYTTDGNDPTTASTKYEDSFTITESCTVKAIAYVGDVASEVASATIAFAKVDTPKFSISSDAVLAGQTVTVSCATANATIYYAFGDNEFAEYTGALTINEATTLKVKATRTNYADSEVATADYTIGEAVAYTLVTSADQLTDGGKYLIAHSDESVILGKYNDKNFFPTTAFSKDNTTISVAAGSQSVNVVTFEYDAERTCWTIKTGLEDQYIAAGSSSSNNVYLNTAITENYGEIKSLTFANDGQTSIKFNTSDEGVRNYFNYGGTYFSCFANDRNVKLYKYLKPVKLSWSDSAAEATLGEDFTAPTLTVDPEAAASAVQYSSSDTEVADFVDGTLTIKAAGTTTIKAAISNDATYQDASASYTLTVNKATATLEWMFEEAVVNDKTVTVTKYSNLFPTLSYSDGIQPSEIALTADNEEVCLIDWVDDAVFAAYGVGTANVTASFAGNDKYEAKTATFTLVVNLDEHGSHTFDFTQSNEMNFENFKVSGGEYKEETLSVAASQEIMINTTDETMGISSITIVTNNNTFSEEPSKYEATYSEGGSEGNGTFQLNGDQLIWTTPDNTLADIVTITAPNAVNIKTIDIAWEWITPVFVSKSVSDDKVLTLQVKNGHKVYYKILSSNNSSTKTNAPAFKAADLTGLTEAGLENDGWTVNDNSYTYKLSDLATTDLMTVYAVNGTKQSEEVTYNQGGQIVSGIEGVGADSQDAPVEYYNLQGVRVSNPGTGLYIRRQGTKVEKVAIR
jgi:hypothetical protein